MTASETPAIARARNSNPGAWERFEREQRAIPRGAAARENDARALERQADYLRGFRLPREDALADELDREAAEVRGGGTSKMGVAA